MQEYKIIGAVFQSSGCAGAHPHTTLDPPRDGNGQGTIMSVPIPAFVKNARTRAHTLVGNKFDARPRTLWAPKRPYPRSLPAL